MLRSKGVAGTTLVLRLSSSRRSLFLVLCWLVVGCQSYWSTTRLRSCSRMFMNNPSQQETTTEMGSLLTMPFADLSDVLQGTGKAKIFWKSIKQGIDPLSVKPLDSDVECLSDKAKGLLREYMLSRHGTTEAALFPTTVTHETLSKCGTRKLLQSLADGQSIESVLIPSYKHSRTTLCVSTQVGCDRGCAFCLTGKMGLMRNLTSAEIVSQVFRGLEVSKREQMPQMTNVVFMGMGDAGRNLESVGAAVNTMVNRDCLEMAPSKITISTVGPSPETFFSIARLPATIAWSLHSPDDSIRRKLVPTTRHTTLELRDGLLVALQSRPKLRHRTIMIALTLIAGINDSEQDALKLVDFVKPMLTIAPKIALDLIPYNDIAVPAFERPTNDRVNNFQRVLRENGLFCSVRVTRGDEDSAACGMLATTEKVKSRLMQKLQ